MSAKALEVPVLALDGPTNRFGMGKHHAHLSDEALVALVARADEDALAELYDRVSRIAYGLALRVLRDERHARPSTRRRSRAARGAEAGGPSDRRLGSRRGAGGHRGGRMAAVRTRTR